MVQEEARRDDEEAVSRTSGGTSALPGSSIQPSFISPLRKALRRGHLDAANPSLAACPPREQIRSAHTNPPPTSQARPPKPTRTRENTAQRLHVREAPGNMSDHPGPHNPQCRPSRSIRHPNRDTSPPPPRPARPSRLASPWPSKLVGIPHAIETRPVGSRRRLSRRRSEVRGAC